MFNLLKKGVGFIKTNPSLLFSLFLIIIIPLSVFWLTSFLAKSFQHSIETTLSNEAMAIEGIFSPYISQYYDQPDILQKRIEYLAKQNPDLSRLAVLLPTENGEFKIIASNKKEKKEPKMLQGALPFAWHNDQAIGFLTEENGVRFWNVIKPFYSQDGKKIGLTNVSLSLATTDKIVSQQLKKAYIFALIIILLILSLVIHHTRLFQYVNLFKRLQQTEKSKDAFMNMAIHELRSPVVNIKNYIAELREETKESLNAEQKEDMKVVEISINRLNGLISDILDVVRIEQGRLSFETEKILPTKVIQETIEELRGKALAKNLKLEFVSSGDTTGAIEVNPNRFKEMIYNLTDNAIKYTKTGTVTVSTKKDVVKNKFYIVIEDTGIGISAEEQAHLFERFYRVRNRETADIDGTGLGLWIVKSLCSKMNGKILLESIKGVGSKFILIFPLVK